MKTIEEREKFDTYELKASYDFKDGVKGRFIINDRNLDKVFTEAKDSLHVKTLKKKMRKLRL